MKEDKETEGNDSAIYQVYQEAYRPQFHFTAPKNWLNDPNGLTYYQGEYHLFFQHNPAGINWGNMTWGHAVSPDMIRWKQLPQAIEPDKLGAIFSGSGVVDWNNSAGFKSGDEAVMVCIYTSAGEPFTQSIAYSNDRGRTWIKYDNNPVLGHILGKNRDPKVIWHAPTESWVMALYLDKNDYALFSSKNLKEWSKLCDIHLPNSGECPDLFALPVDGDPKNIKWVFWGANGNHYIGSFDGINFRAESDLLCADWGANFYAAQTWSDIPKSDGRCLQIAWMRGGKYPNMPFNQQMSFPCELRLKTTPEGIRLFRQPVKELENIRQKGHSWNNLPLTSEAEDNPLSKISSYLLDIQAEIELGGAAEIRFAVRGETIEYNVSEKRISSLGRSALLAPIGAENRIKLQILVDQTSIELFGNEGRVSMTSCFLPDLKNSELGIYAFGGRATALSLRLYELSSIWGRANVA